jgi:hypothetical protein
MSPVETIPESGERGLKENDGRGEFNCDILLRTFCKHNVSPIQQ